MSSVTKNRDTTGAATNSGPVVVGGGHNGLVAAFYLAKAGLRPLVLERREIVGGACVTEEFAPGFFASSGAYVLSMLRDAIWRDLRLVERGLVVDPAGPSLHLFDDEEHLLVHEDLEALAGELRRFSEHDARQIVRFEAELARVARLVTPLMDWTPPDILSNRAGDIGRMLRYGLRGARFRGEITDALWAFATSARQYLDEWFENDYVKTVLGWHAINDSLSGPSTPGTAYVLMHDHAAEDSDGGVRSWGFVRGGIGQVTELMAQAAREQGATIRTGAEVQEIVVKGGRVSGVRLSDGEFVPASVVLSNADPKRTLLSLLDESQIDPDIRARVEAYRCEGTSMKITLGLSALPRVHTVGDAAGVVQDHHKGIMEITGMLGDLDRAQAEARAGIPARDPHIEMVIPTVHDPELAPAGCHVVTIDVNSQPYTLAEGDWDTIKEKAADAAIARIARHMPDLPSTILHREVLSPLDLERRIGLTGGHALHGEMGFDQLFALRPIRGYADYRAPVAGLYLCGAGTHPGGGVTGANGRNCAREVLRDRRAASKRALRVIGGGRLGSREPAGSGRGHR